MGVLCSPCRRRVTKWMRATDNEEFAQYCEKRLKEKRRRNRRFVHSPVMYSGLSDGALGSSLADVSVGHCPQEGHW